MDRISSLLLLCGSKIPRQKFKLMSPKYNAVSSAVSSASCSNDFITSTSKSVSTNISTTCNNLTYARISESNLALTTILIFEPIYTISLLLSTPHSSCSNIGIERWAQNLITPRINLSYQLLIFLIRLHRKIFLPPLITTSRHQLFLTFPLSAKTISNYGWLLSNTNFFFLISTEQRRFSAMLGAADYNVIRRVQKHHSQPGTSTLLNP